MAESIQYTCDVCGAVKQGTNHWWKLGVYGNGRLSLIQWGTGFNSVPEKLFHVCGRSCVLRKVEEFMGDGK